MGSTVAGFLRRGRIILPGGGMASRKGKTASKTRRRYKCPKCRTVYVSNPRLKEKTCEECGLVEKPIWLD